MRADAERNRRRIVAAASETMAEQGANASLEEIARRAGVGSATLHRHFAGRRDLVEAVFSERVGRLCAHADDLPTDEPGTALRAWLREVGRHAAANRGLAESFAPEDAPTNAGSCHRLILGTGDRLLTAAVDAGEVCREVTAADLITLAIAISRSTEGHPDEADRLLTLALRGINP
ncbi:helix-turn-helix domain-containing protein [Actinosynnema sp. NPDC020468]|uniref:TetR/AcrR family transcriptional regulator n=1 Tax=Actinosynnema sp. NPDC020468 TaxID=3154488 RepID=UPI0033FAA2C8